MPPHSRLQLLVAKSFPERPRSRHWKLKHLDKESELRPEEAKRQERDYELFLQSLESDPELRSNINLYKGTALPCGLFLHCSRFPVPRPVLLLSLSAFPLCGPGLS
jgi:hypothetical protein